MAHTLLPFQVDEDSVREVSKRLLAGDVKKHSKIEVTFDVFDGKVVSTKSQYLHLSREDWGDESAHESIRKQLVSHIFLLDLDYPNLDIQTPGLEDSARKYVSQGVVEDIFLDYCSRAALDNEVFMTSFGTNIGKVMPNSKDELLDRIKAAFSP